jgi:hypothetical protein
VYDLTDFGALDGIMPEPVLRGMIAKQSNDKRHTGTNITITSGLGCPRKLLVNRMLDVTPDPQKLWKMHRGTWLHEHMGLMLGENEDWYTEEINPERCEYAGTLFGVELSCKVDAVRKDYTRLLDWKFRADGNEKFIDPMGAASATDAAQVNMARLLMQQVLNRDLSDMLMQVWIMAGECVRTTAPLMTEYEIGQVRPGSGQYNVSQIFGFIGSAMEEWKTAAATLGCDVNDVPLATKHRIIQRIPMVGQYMYRNARKPMQNGCTSYCEVKDECFGVEGGI